MGMLITPLSSSFFLVSNERGVSGIYESTMPFWRHGQILLDPVKQTTPKLALRPILGQIYWKKTWVGDRRFGHRNSKNPLHDTSEHSLKRACNILSNDICSMTGCNLDFEFKVNKRLLGSIYVNL